MKRILPLTTYRGQLEARQVHSRGVSAIVPPAKPLDTPALSSVAPLAAISQEHAGRETLRSNMIPAAAAVSSGVVSNTDIGSNAVNTNREPSIDDIFQNITRPAANKVLLTLSEQIENAKNKNQLSQLWTSMPKEEKVRMSAYDVNKIMSTALSFEAPALAVRVFEDMCGFAYAPQGTAEALYNTAIQNENSESMYWSSQGASNYKPYQKPLVKPNNFICTTAAKAYGRNGEAGKAVALLPWLEEQGDTPDIYFLSALLYVCAKDRRVKEAEHLFWHEIPRRNLSYAVATTNSIMYMYARQNRPDDALRVYDMTKRLGIKCTVVTYGVLIKALLRSGRKQLLDAYYEILRSLTDIGISPGIEVYNQFLEHFSNTHDFRQTKIILKLMTRSSPKVKPDALSYGYVINCFADAKKPRSALTAYRQMRNARISSNAYTYMGVLKALFHLRDGISSVQVLAEMREVGVIPDKRHNCMAMFTCVASDMCPLAESIFNSLLKTKPGPDTALYTLYLRALLQQSKWEEAEALFNKMLIGKDSARPNSFTLNYLIQYQMLGARWNKADETLNIIAEGVANSVKLSSSSFAASNGNVTSILTKKPSSSSMGLVLPVSTLHGTFQAMSMSLGSYSTALQRFNQQENLRLQRAEDALKGEDDLFFTPEAYDYMSPQMKIDKPSKETLRFLVQASYKLSNLDCGYISGDFYAELLRALAMEGEPWVAQEVMKSLQSKVRVKVDDQEKVALAEEIVNKVCIELNKAGRSASAGKWLSTTTATDKV